MIVGCRRRARGLVFAATFLLGAAPAQQPAAPTQDVPSSSLLAQLTSPQLRIAEARQIAGQLRGRTFENRIALFDALRRVHNDRRQACAAAAERIARQFKKAVPETQHDLIVRGGESKLETLRSDARAITNREGLTKEMIHDELDPLLAELRALVLPTTEQVLAHDPELAAATDALRRDIAELDSWFDLWLEAAHLLDDQPEGRRHVAKTPPFPQPEPPAALDAEFARARLSALPLSAHDQRVLEDNEALRARLDPAEFAGTQELNRIRIALGLPALLIDEKLGNAARDHSQDMAKLGFFDHTSPVPGKKTFGDRASRAGTSASSENIAAGQTRGEGAIQAWWYSPGHHKNMLGPHARTGLGRSDTMWTQLFGG